MAGDAAVEIPVYQCDAILDGPESVGRPQQPFDFVVGNPPWIAWDNLPEPYRQATKPLWEGYGLFSLSGNQARHGGGKKDLSMLMLYRSADRYLKPLGRLGMVVAQSLFQTKGAGDGFRRFRLGQEGDWLRVDRVDDLVALKPFPGGASRTSTIVLTKGGADRISGGVCEMDARPRRRPRPEPLLGTADRRGPARLAVVDCDRRTAQMAEARRRGRRITRPTWAPTAAAPMRSTGCGCSALRRRRTGAEPCGKGQTGRAGRRAGVGARFALSPAPLGRRASLVGAAVGPHPLGPRRGRGPASPRP